MTKNNSSQIPSQLVDLAGELGEENLSIVGSFKTKVFSGEKLIFKVSEFGKKNEKEEYVLDFLAKNLPDSWQKVIPHIVQNKEIDALGMVEVQNKLAGSHPSYMRENLAVDMGKFLSDLHNIKKWDKITEFEGGEEVDFHEYLISSSRKFLNKLEGILDASDFALVQKAGEQIQIFSNELHHQPELVLVHKDIHLNNILVDDNYKITGILDWGAAQVAPREWEFAILRQRMPDFWLRILDFYEFKNLDYKLMDVCGLVQSLRFWKSFPRDEVFVKQQKDYILAILDKYQ